MPSSYSWTISSDLVAAVVNGRVRVTFPADLLATDSLLVTGNYDLQFPAGGSPLTIQRIISVSDTVIDIEFSGKMIPGLYTLVIVANTYRFAYDGFPNVTKTVDFQGKTQKLSSANMGINASALLGKGLSFPLRVGTDGEFVKSSGEDNVDECLYQLLMTAQGERPFVTRDGILFGTQLRQVLFEDTQAARELAYQTVNQAITVWEPRVQLLELNVPNSPDNTVSVQIKYLVIATNEIRNMVFPFYLNNNS